MNLGVYNGSKVTEPDFSKQISFVQIWAKMAQNGPKMLILTNDTFLFRQLQGDITWLDFIHEKNH